MTIHDKKLRLGACGETELANAKQSLIMMMLVLSLKFLVGHLIFLLLAYYLFKGVSVKGAPGFECRTGGPGGGEASEGLKKFTKVRLKFYF